MAACKFFDEIYIQYIHFFPWLNNLLIRICYTLNEEWQTQLAEDGSISGQNRSTDFHADFPLITTSQCNHLIFDVTKMIRLGTRLNSSL